MARDPYSKGQCDSPKRMDNQHSPESLDTFTPSQSEISFSINLGPFLCQKFPKLNKNISYDSSFLMLLKDVFPAPLYSFPSTSPESPHIYLGRSRYPEPARGYL
jgi:hypothetical protein